MVAVAHLEPVRRERLAAMDRLPVETTRFGDILVDGDAVVHLPDGLLGFEDVHRYCLFTHTPGSPFQWLQAMEIPDLAFVVIDPFAFFTTYEFEISDGDTYHLALQGIEDVSVLAVVTFAERRITANLAGPIIVNRRTHNGKQIVLSDPRYGTRHSLIPEGSDK